MKHSVKQYKKPLFLFILSLIISLMLYEKEYYYLEEPQKFGGYKIEAFGRIKNQSQDYFYFDIGEETIKVFGKNVKKPVLGETVLYIDFRKDGKIVMIDYHNYNFNCPTS